MTPKQNKEHFCTLISLQESDMNLISEYRNIKCPFPQVNLFLNHILFQKVTRILNLITSLNYGGARGVMVIVAGYGHSEFKSWT